MLTHTKICYARKKTRHYMAFKPLSLGNKVEEFKEYLEVLLVRVFRRIKAIMSLERNYV